MAKLKIIWASWNNLIMRSENEVEKNIASLLHEVYNWEVININNTPILHGNKNKIDYYINFNYISDIEFEYSVKGVFVIEYGEPIIKIIGNSYLIEKEGNQEVIPF